MRGRFTTAKRNRLGGARSRGRFLCRVHRRTGRLADINGKLLRGTKAKSGYRCVKIGTLEFYSADLPGVPRALKDRHWCHYEANKHWIEWVDDGLSERADVGPAKKRAALPASLRG